MNSKMSEVYNYYNADTQAEVSPDTSVVEGDESEIEAGDVTRTPGEHNNAVTKGLDSLLYRIDDAYEKYSEKKEAFKENSKEVGGKALNFAKKAGSVGATIGLTSLGVVILGAQAGANAVKAGFGHGKSMANEFKDALKENYNDIKSDASETKDAFVETKNNVVESITGKIGEVKEAYKNARDAARERKQQRSEAREQSKIDAAEKRKNALEAAAEAREKAKIARQEARDKFIENTKESLDKKKDKVTGGAKKIAGLALNFFKRAKSSGDAAVEAWKNFQPEAVENEEA